MIIKSAGAAIPSIKVACEGKVTVLVVWLLLAAATFLSQPRKDEPSRESSAQSSELHAALNSPNSRSFAETILLRNAERGMRSAETALAHHSKLGTRNPEHGPAFPFVRLDQDKQLAPSAFSTLKRQP